LDKDCLEDSVDQRMSIHLRMKVCPWLIAITRGIFVMECRSGSSFSGGRQPELRSETFFFPAIDITKLGVSCYPTTLLSNKLAQRPLKFQRVMAYYSSHFVQLLKKTPPDRILGHLCVFFF
jgi:hypothetical protein